jgi:hypothetical protein
VKGSYFTKCEIASRVFTKCEIFFAAFSSLAISQIAKYDGIMEHLESPESVVLALGGVRAVGEMTGVKPSTVYNWCHRGRFPPATYLAFAKVFESRGLTADPRLWRMTIPATEAGQ